MWQKIITAFFFGQVALEQATEASKKQLEAAREKAQDYKEKAKEKVKEKTEAITHTNFVAKVGEFAKEKVAHLRSCSEPFEKTCLSVTKFLGETADIKSKLVTEPNS
jgi:hypothetical protein